VETRFEVRTEQDGDSRNVETKLVKAKVLVGADGIWSGVRKLVVGDEPRDLCLITWLSVVPTDRIRLQTHALLLAQVLIVQDCFTGFDVFRKLNRSSFLWQVTGSERLR
jgi:2-polyprenyl-6-methoxyphenol hydroxylase-like FAD-dependent oxidoreductase